MTVEKRWRILSDRTTNNGAEQRNALTQNTDTCYETVAQE